MFLIFRLQSVDKGETTKPQRSDDDGVDINHNFRFFSGFFEFRQLQLQLVLIGTRATYPFVSDFVFRSCFAHLVDCGDHRIAQENKQTTTTTTTTWSKKTNEIDYVRRCIQKTSNSIDQRQLTMFGDQLCAVTI